MLACAISTGTPRRQKMPVLIAKPTGTRAGPETSYFKNQCDESTPGAMKSTRVAAKGIRGKAWEAPRRGTSRITAAELESRTRASRDLRRRVNSLSPTRRWPGKRVHAHVSALKHRSGLGTATTRL